MIVVGVKADGVCIIHAIAGPESAMDLDLHGHASVDITELVQACTQGRRVVLKLTRSLCEAETAKALAGHGIATTETAAAPVRPQQQLPAMPAPAPDVDALLRRPCASDGVCRICGAIAKGLGLAGRAARLGRGTAAATKLPKGYSLTVE